VAEIEDKGFKPLASSSADYRPTLGHRLQYGLVWLVFLLANLSPRVLARFNAWLLGNFLYLVLGRRRRIAEGNLRERLGLDARAAARTARRNFCRTVANLVDFMRLPYFTEARRRRWMTVEGVEHLRAALAERGGVILASAHAGPWELTSAWLSAEVAPGAALATRQHNQLVDGFLNRLRVKAGLDVVFVDSELRPVVRALKKNRILYVLGDQDAGPGGEFVEFLGAPASFHRGTGYFAYKLGAPVCFGFARRGESGRLYAQIFPALHADRSADEETEVRRLTREYARALEDWVRRHPADWYWLHRRWKTKSLA
jgi:KDO2-lipid IV(A) lauroyltransferase